MPSQATRLRQVPSVRPRRTVVADPVAVDAPGHDVHPQQLAAAGRHRAVIPGAGLGFGQPDTAILGVGEAADQHAVPVDVAGGEDVGTLVRR